MDTVGVELLSQVQEGQLYKYTNVVKGWQHRWFILDPREGTLSYFLVSVARARPTGPRSEPNALTRG